MSDNGRTSNYISDGYTATVYFEGVYNIHDPFRATYRPLTVATGAKLNQDLAACGDDIERRQWVAARWMSQQTVEWDVRKKDGTPVSHKDVNELMRMGLTVFHRYWNVINNLDGGDPDPQETEYERQKRSLTEQAAAMSGESKMETLEKN